MNLPITRTSARRAYLTKNGNTISLKPELMIVNGGYVGEKAKLETNVGKLLPADVKEEKIPEPAKDKEVYHENDIPLLLPGGICLECD